MPLLNKGALDHATAHGCEVPGCSHKDHDWILYLHSRCHPTGRIEASYKHGSGTLRIGCAECSRVIAEIKVGD